MFPLEIGEDQFPTVRRLDKSVDSGATLLIEKLGLPKTPKISNMIAAYLGDAAYNDGFDALQSYVSNAWEVMSDRQTIIMAHGIVSRALAGLGIGLQFPKLVDLVN